MTLQKYWIPNSPLQCYYECAYWYSDVLCSPFTAHIMSIQFIVSPVYDTLWPMMLYWLTVVPNEQTSTTWPFYLISSLLLNSSVQYAHITVAVESMRTPAQQCSSSKFKSCPVCLSACCFKLHIAFTETTCLQPACHYHICTQDSMSKNRKDASNYRAFFLRIRCQLQ